jgi:sugar phosphate isomerase/epimerase
MELQLFATIAPLLPLSECAHAGTLEALLLRLRALGYRGIEVQLSQLLVLGVARFAAALECVDFLWIAKIYSSGGAAACPFAAGFTSHPEPGETVAAHLRVWAASLAAVLDVPASLRARLVHVNSQTGRDYFHRAGGAEADAFFSRALDAEAAAGVLVAHETHRHRLLFSPFLAVDAIRAHPRLRLLADLSHYANVCEAQLTGDAPLEAALSELAPRFVHIHARVGFEEGPQIEDARALAAAAALRAHGRWWAAYFLAARARGDARVTATPEFLPPAYARDGDDVAESNAFMARYVKALFSHVIGEGEAIEMALDVADREARLPNNSTELSE